MTASRLSDSKTSPKRCSPEERTGKVCNGRVPGSVAVSGNEAKPTHKIIRTGFNNVACIPDRIAPERVSCCSTIANESFATGKGADCLTLADKQQTAALYSSPDETRLKAPRQFPRKTGSRRPQRLLVADSQHVRPVRQWRPRVVKRLPNFCQHTLVACMGSIEI